jgi:hypothetical protein
LPSAPRRAWSSLIPQARFLGAVVVENLFPLPFRSSSGTLLDMPSFGL